MLAMNEYKRQKEKWHQKDMHSIGWNERASDEKLKAEYSDS